MALVTVTETFEGCPVGTLDVADTILTNASGQVVGGPTYAGSRAAAPSSDGNGQGQANLYFVAEDPITGDDIPLIEVSGWFHPVRNVGNENVSFGKLLSLDGVGIYFRQQAGVPDTLELLFGTGWGSTFTAVQGTFAWDAWIKLTIAHDGSTFTLTAGGLGSYSAAGDPPTEAEAMLYRYSSIWYADNLSFTYEGGEIEGEVDTVRRLFW